MMQIDPNDWTISQPLPGSKGGKTCLVSSSNNKPIEINMGLGNPFGCPWGASSFDDDATQTRVNLDMTLDDDGADLFRQIDEWLIAYAIKHKNVLFSGSKSKTDAQITDSYRRLAREKEGFRPMLRTKINLEKVRCWDETHQQTKVPVSKFKNTDIWPKMLVRTLWIIGSGSWGLTLEVTDVKYKENQMLCPF
jgi:hypothetical protein